MGYSRLKNDAFKFSLNLILVVGIITEYWSRNDFCFCMRSVQALCESEPEESVNETILLSGLDTDFDNICVYLLNKRNVAV